MGPLVHWPVGTGTGAMDMVDEADDGVEDDGVGVFVGVGVVEAVKIVDDVLLIGTWGDVLRHCLRYVAAPGVEPGTKPSTALK
jgi:hypothetical protein